ncbi:MAG: flippase [bacterium]|uniref:Flippase n=1 Tax=Candidatus Aphodosoma intestinipullorum TaxID=2840674 RepID=A0A940DKX1_9BACT|nr:flippase [Candidatus Aphodosoma intestinipullorum]
MSLLDRITSRLNISETKRKIFRNLYWAVMGKTVSLFGSLFVGILVARYLGPEQYGLMNYVISYVALFQIFASFGMDNIEIREMSRQDADTDVILGTAFRIKLVLALITMALVIGTAIIFESDHFTVVMIALYSVSIILNRFTVIRNYFTSIVWNEYIVKTEISRTIIGAAIKIALLLIKAPLWAFIAATTFDFALLSAGYVMAYRTKIGSMSLWRYDSTIAKYLLKQSFPMLLTSAAVLIYQRIDQVMIGKLLDNTSVGIFSVAVRLVEIVVFIPTIMSQTITPILVRIKERDEQRYHIKSQMFMNVTLWLCIIISILLSLCSSLVIYCTFGKQYSESVPILRVLAFKASAVALSYTAGQMIIIEKLQKYAVIRDVFGCIVCVLLNYFLLPIYGVIAASYVAIIANLAAGYFADIFIPKYRHIFTCQCRAILLGWKDLRKLLVMIK